MMTAAIYRGDIKAETKELSAKMKDPFNILTGVDSRILCCDHHIHGTVVVEYGEHGQP